MVSCGNCGDCGEYAECGDHLMYGKHVPMLGELGCTCVFYDHLRQQRRVHIRPYALNVHVCVHILCTARCASSIPPIPDGISASGADMAGHGRHAHE